MVAELCVAIGGRLGITGDRLERLRLAGLLHDVGKIGVADAILQKKTALGEDERRRWPSTCRSATRSSWPRNCRSKPTGSSITTSATTAPATQPACNGAKIPLEARIIAVADAFEAMTGPRPYRDSISSEAALSSSATRPAPSSTHAASRPSQRWCTTSRIF